MRKRDRYIRRQIRCYLIHSSKKINKKRIRIGKGRKDSEQAFQRGRYLFPKVRHGLRDHKMISYELSYELRRDEESLERKREERQLAELDTV